MKNLIALAKNGKINENAGLRDRQSVIINAQVEDIWEALKRMEQWHEWVSNIQVTKPGPFQEDASFEWKLNGKKLKSTFRKISEPEMISWTSTSGSLKIIHVWSIEKVSDQQAIVTLEESVQGFFLPIFSNHSKLNTTLLSWLSCLKQEVEKSLSL